MQRIGIRELRDNLTSTIRRVRSGEAFQVTHDGEPVALLTPLPSNRVSRLRAAGVLRPATRQLDLTKPLPRATGPMTASEALEEDRSGR